MRTHFICFVWAVLGLAGPAAARQSQSRSFFDPEASPFGIHNPKIPDRPYDGAPLFGKLPPGYDAPGDVSRVGAKWSRYCGFEGLVWDLVEKEPGVYDWSRTDYMFGEAAKSGLNLTVVVMGFNRRDQPEVRLKGNALQGKTPNDLPAFLRFLRSAVERYDGDGIDDAPGSPRVGYWEIENEVDLAVFWQDTPENYARLLAQSCRTIKRADPNAKVLISATAGPGVSPGFDNFFPRVFSALEKMKRNPGERFFDILSFHVYGQNAADLSSLKPHLERLRREWTKWGYGNIPIWLTETATHSGKPKGGVAQADMLRERTEAQQAADVIKIYVGALASEVSKIFWVTLTEWYGFNGQINGFWDNVGLIKNSLAGGRSYRKISYYAYKKMVETLEGSDWSKIETVQEKGGVYAYKFTKAGKPIWVAWNDSGVSARVALSNVPLDGLTITEAVPLGVTGNAVKDDSTAFSIRRAAASNGRAVVSLNNGSPVFIEPFADTSSTNRR